jgi:hypothetical protein
MSVPVSPDGKRAACIVYNYFQMQLPDAGESVFLSTLHWVDLDHPNRQHEVLLPYHDMYGRNLSLSPGGAYALVDDDLLVHLDSGRRISLSNVKEDQEGDRRRVFFIGDSQVLCATQHGWVQIELKNGRFGKPEPFTTLGPDAIHLLAISPDSTYAVMTLRGSANKDYLQPAMLDLKTRKITTFGPEIAKCPRTEISTDSSTVLLSSVSAAIVFDAKTLKTTDITRNLLQQFDEMPLLDLSHDGKHIVGKAWRSAHAAGDAMWVTAKPWSAVSIPKGLAPLLAPGARVEHVSCLCPGWLYLLVDQPRPGKYPTRFLAAKDDFTQIMEIYPGAEGSPRQPLVVWFADGGFHVQAMTNNAHSQGKPAAPAVPGPPVPK